MTHTGRRAWFSTFAAAALLGLAPVPALAAPGNSFGDLRDTLASCTGTTAAPTTVALTADIADPASPLDVACVAVIDLAGHDLSAESIRIGTGQQLTIDDTAEVDGTLTVATRLQEAGIHTTGATLIVLGGTLDITGGSFSAGIGGNYGEAGGTVRIEGGTVTAGSLPWGGAAIGGGNNGDGGKITITGGTVNIGVDDRGAGLGSGYGGAGGEITITGGTITAKSGDRATAIGGNDAEITITGGTVTATGGEGGDGIGGDGSTTSISGGTINASGGYRGDGIGGDGSTTSISGGTVTATGGDRGIGIRAGAAGTTITGGTVQVSGELGIAGPDLAGAPVTISGAAVVTIDATYPLSAWGGNAGPLTIEDSARLTLNGGQVIVPAGEDHGIEIRDEAVLAGDPTVTGAGSISNNSIVLIDSELVEVPVFGHHYQLSFETAGGEPVPDPVIVFAPTLAEAGQTLPTGIARGTDQLTGWLLGTDPLTEQTTLPRRSVDGDAVALEATAAWSPTSLTTGLPGDAATLAAGETVTFTPTVLDAEGVPVATDPATWTVTGDADLTVDTSTGEVTAAATAAGIAPLTLTVPYGVGEHSAQIDLTVEAGPTAAIELTASTTVVDQGDSVTITATGADDYGNSTGDVTDEVTLSSDVASDEIEGNRITFPHASPHTITGTHASGATATVVVEVAPAATDPAPEPTPDPAPEPTTVPAPEPTTDPAPEPTTESQLPQTGTDFSVPAAAAAAALLLIGAAALLLARRRRTL